MIESTRSCSNTLVTLRNTVHKHVWHVMEVPEQFKSMEAYVYLICAGEFDNLN